MENHFKKKVFGTRNSMMMWTRTNTPISSATHIGFEGNDSCNWDFCTFPTAMKNLSEARTIAIFFRLAFKEAARVFCSFPF